ncbi:PREDICTED: spermatogenic leucine zipper protein 1 [Elephantulus edwardii]|uniref:spermatogenic leucine zipper protein 1 n=1 Tax=Elephantulus edwardii TaxID=28737 RepID=UPI0003F0874A|nr:PREDICTED: spermatogenic leucine zipper protein 1 [Elephantulus edwardii]
METPTLSETLRLAPDLPQESWDRRMVIALFEIGSISLFFWSSLLSLKNSNQIAEQLTTQNFENVLNRIKHVLQNMTGFEKTTVSKGSLEGTSVPEDVSNLKEKIRGLEKINKALCRNVLSSLDSEKFQDAKKQEKIFENHNSKDMPQIFARDLANHSEGKRTYNEIEICKEKPKYGLHQEENIKFRNSMEKLLQKAEHWSEEHSELSGLIKSYQQSQHDLREFLGKNEVHVQDKPRKVSVNDEMEKQVKKLEQNTYSLQLTAALLENECQNLQQRLGLLNELQEKQRIQTGYAQRKKEQTPSEAKKPVETYRQKLMEMASTPQKGDSCHVRLDVFRNRKAHNNLLNSCIARRGRGAKKRSASRPNKNTFK